MPMIVHFFPSACKVDDLPDIDNSDRTIVGTTFMDSVQYDCHVGYEFPDFSTQLSVTCNWDETWTSPTYAKCQGKNVDKCNRIYHMA